MATTSWVTPTILMRHFATEVAKAKRHSTLPPEVSRVLAQIGIHEDDDQRNPLLRPNLRFGLLLLKVGDEAALLSRSNGQEKDAATSTLARMNMDPAQQPHCGHEQGNRLPSPSSKEGGTLNDLSTMLSPIPPLVTSAGAPALTQPKMSLNASSISAYLRPNRETYGLPAPHHPLAQEQGKARLYPGAARGPAPVTAGNDGERTFLSEQRRSQGYIRASSACPRTSSTAPESCLHHRRR